MCEGRSTVPVRDHTWKLHKSVGGLQEHLYTRLPGSQLNPAFDRVSARDLASCLALLLTRWSSQWCPRWLWYEEMDHPSRRGIRSGCNSPLQVGSFGSRLECFSSRINHSMIASPHLYNNFKWFDYRQKTFQGPEMLFKHIDLVISFSYWNHSDAYILLKHHFQYYIYKKNTIFLPSDVNFVSTKVRWLLTTGSFLSTSIFCKRKV